VSYEAIYFRHYLYDEFMPTISADEGGCCATIRMRIAVNQDENDFALLWRSEGEARTQAKQRKIGSNLAFG
jgi:hypothetical protein